jgi:hypothetical protein
MRISTHLRWLLFAGCAQSAISVAGQELRYLRFEPQAAKTETSASSASRIRGSRQTPAPYIYNPRTRVSVTNQASIFLRATSKASQHIEVRFDPEKEGANAGIQSFTLEMFVKATNVWHGPVAFKTPLQKTSSTWMMGSIYLSQHKQTYLGANARPPGGKTVRWTTGHHLSISRLRKESLNQWRHLAFVHDAEARTATLFVDYYEYKRVQLAKPLKWDAAPLLLGGQYDGAGLHGWMDEVRLSDIALGPGEFLRAVDESLEDVDFVAKEEVLPLDAGQIDFVEGFGGVGDGKFDNTKAFRKAFRELANKVPLAYNTLYIPPGVYLVSDTLRWSRFLIVQGAGKDRTTIKLLDSADGFGFPGQAKPLAVVSAWNGRGRGSGSSIGSYLFDLTLSTGAGNPGATALMFHANNHGAVENVAIRSEDGEGKVGVDMRWPWPGPALLKHVSVDGFDYGMRLAHQEYSMTMEHVILRGQKVAGIHNLGNILALRKIHSTNSVPAIINAGANGMVTILDSVLSGGAQETTAILNRGGLYARNIQTEGYESAVLEEWKEAPDQLEFQRRVIPGPAVEEHVSQDRVTMAFESRRGSLKLPIEETPIVARGDLKKDWVNVRKFAERKRGKDWTPAIQAAIDSGARTVYFPQGAYDVYGSVHLSGAVERLFGMKAMIGRPKDIEGDWPAMIFDDADGGKTVSIERLQIRGFQHLSSATLVVRHGEITPYRTGPDCGKLFIEDSVSADWHFDHPQQVWARQWNVEQHGAGPAIVSKGATIWSLGFKTEYESSKLWASDGAQTEILGAFINPTGRIPEDRPIFQNTDSRMSLVYGTSVYRSNHRVHVRDTKGGETRDVVNDALNWQGSRARMDLFVSDPIQE